MSARGAAALAVGVACVLAVPAARAQTAGPRVALVVEVAPPPIVGGDGRLLDDARPTLDRLIGALDVIDAAGVPLALSISPVLVEQLRLVGAGGARAHAALLRAATRHPVLARPFADASLPRLGEADAGRELERGIQSLRRSLDTEPLPVMHPPGLDLDTAVLRTARANGITTVLASSGDIGARVVRTDDVVLVPARRPPDGDLFPTGRQTVAWVVDVLDPRLGELPSADAATGPVPLDDLASTASPSTARFEAVAPAPASYTEAVRRAAASVDTFASYTLDDNRVREMLEVVLGIAQSSVHWEDRWAAGRDLAGAVTDRVSEERDLVYASQGSVTLTSQRGTVPVTVINLATYPVRVRVRVASPRLGFPGGTTALLVVSPQGDTTTFVAEAHTPGTFPLEVRVTSPDGDVSFGSGEVLVRSIAARTPALVLTAGAALFLVLWSARSLHRRRRARTR